MRCIFIRTSTTEQNPTLQINDVSTAFKLTDYSVIEERDSAYKESAKRLEFEKLKKLIINGKVNELFVWDLDRLYRNRKKLIEFLALCKVHNTKVFSFNQQWLQAIQQLQQPFNEIMFDFMLSIMGWLAEDESIKKSNRVKMAIRKNNNITESYLGNKWGRKSISKQTISKIEEFYLEGKSTREITKLVQIYDINKNGRPISKSAVHKYISNFKAKKGSI